MVLLECLDIAINMLLSGDSFLVYKCPSDSCGLRNVWVRCQHSFSVCYE